MPRGTVIPFIPDVPSTDDARPRGESLSHLIALHRLHRLPELRESTQASYRQTYQLAESLGAFPSVGQVGAWVTWLRREYPPPEGCTDSWTVHLHWHNLAALYTWAQTWGYASGCNPAACLRLRKPTPRARAIVNVEELWPAILGACHDLRERTFMQAARDFGVRRGELLGLMPEDLVTFGEPWRMQFRRQRPDPNSWETTPLKKNGANRSLPLTRTVRDMLTELLSEGAPKVWVGRGRQQLIESPFLFPYRIHDMQSLRERCGAVAPTAFPPGDWVHTLRHTLSFEMNRSNSSDEEVQKQLGHTSPQSTREVYINLHARPVDAGPLARVEAARRHGVVKWGSPPGRNGPAGVVPAGPRSGGAAVAAVAPPRRSKSQSNQRGQEATCSTPTQKRKSRTASASAATPAVHTGTGKTSAASSPAPARSSAGRQRALPGLSVQRVTVRPRPGRS
jgi:integrase